MRGGLHEGRLGFHCITVTFLWQTIYIYRLFCLMQLKLLASVEREMRRGGGEGV